MEQKKITPNETLQLHELLAFKNLCLTKSVTMSSLVTDPDLKSILQQDKDISEGHIKELKSFMNQSETAEPGGISEKL